MKVIATSKLSELKQFVCWFNQDFDILFASASEGAEACLENLSCDRKSTLAVEVEHLLTKNYGKDGKSQKNAWRKLGGCWWDRDQMQPILRELAAFNINDVPKNS